jgi:hypothetical protein
MTLYTDRQHSGLPTLFLFAQLDLPSAIQFSHIHLYADAVRPLGEYKTMEDRSNRFAGLLIEKGCLGADGCANVEEGRKLWASLGGPAGTFTSQGQDVIEQLIVGAGFRVTGTNENAQTRTMCLSTSARAGVNVIVTAQLPGGPYPTAEGSDAFGHFGAKRLERFGKCHGQRQGIAVLSFDVNNGDVARIHRRYQQKHPKLVTPDALATYDGVQVLEVFAYYKGAVLTSEADEGTVIRFIERPHERDVLSEGVLPGLTPTEATWRKGALDFKAFCDHWVSNVVSREGFLQTLEDGLGFLPQVEFNAGVVAAGEARIESTVTGNKSTFRSTDKVEAFQNQSQVYLPINNALSDKGHVHWFIEELGQGVQHVASRVLNLIDFVQSVNDQREMTGCGFSFLRIPRSYYGTLEASALVEGAGVSAATAEAAIAALQVAGVADKAGVVTLDVTSAKVAAACAGVAGFSERAEAVTKVVLKSRYSNLYKLLRDHCSESTYLGIVRNQILVDVQGDDLLYQIFTSNILQRQVGEESPFFEFIQRVCSEKVGADGACKVLRPGCGGFGIRNFLTLFL